MKNVSIEALVGKKIGVSFSSGFFGCYAHAGFLAALLDLGVRPAGFSGSSSGAIMAALAASGLDSGTIQRTLFGLKKQDIWDPEPSIMTALASLKLFKGWQGKIKGEKIKGLLARILPVSHIEETPTPCVITGTNLTRRKCEVFSEGSIADAVHAAIAVPWLFKFKHLSSELYVDGGLVDKAPTLRLADRIKPEIIIVHYLTSDEIRTKGNHLLGRRFTPQLAFKYAMNIGRHENYLLQKRLLQERDIQVIEITPDVPQVQPDRMQDGPIAYQKAYDHCLSYFERAD